LTLHPYLKDTEPAVQHLFQGLGDYYSDRLPSILQYRDETGVIRMTREKNEEFLNAYKAHFALETARAALAGSILQIAYSGLKQYPSKKTVNPEFSDLGVKSVVPHRAFCVGRLVRNLPIGLLIYAGRIQYNHWEEGEPTNPVARQVFRELVISYSDDPGFDLGYVLDYPAPRPVSHYIVRLELAWRSYDAYLQDMTQLLAPLPEHDGSA
jgi:hypothetical protein